MAKYTLTLEDIINGVDILLKTEDDIDLDNPTSATILITEVMDFLENHIDCCSEVGRIH